MIPHLLRLSAAVPRVPRALCVRFHGAEGREGPGNPENGAERARSTGMTMSGDSGQPAAARGSARHVPVLAYPALEHLNIRDGGVYVDGTFGAGGYTRLILEAPN